MKKKDYFFGTITIGDKVKTTTRSDIDSKLQASINAPNCGVIVSSRNQFNTIDSCVVFSTNGYDDQNDDPLDTWIGRISFDNKKNEKTIKVNPYLMKILPKNEFKELKQTLINIIKLNKPGEAAEDILLHLNYIEESN
jgi:hypothetical protein